MTFLLKFPVYKYYDINYPPIVTLTISYMSMTVIQMYRVQLTF